MNFLEVLLSAGLFIVLVATGFFIVMSHATPFILHITDNEETDFC